MYFSKVGIGCGRVGSLGNATPLKAVRETLVSAANNGVTFFDTANIYGQGDSERVLGSLFSHRDDIAIITKAGNVFSKKVLMLSKIKPVFRFLMGTRNRVHSLKSKTSVNLAGNIGAVRANEITYNFSPAGLRGSLEGSLRRLRRKYVDGFLLHDPSPEQIKSTDIVNTLIEFKKQGRVKLIGASISSGAELQAVVEMGCYDLVQVPMGLLTGLIGSEIYACLLKSGIIIHVRQVLGRGVDGKIPQVNKAIEHALSLPGVSSVVVGVSTTTHLDEIMNHAY